MPDHLSQTSHLPSFLVIGGQRCGSSWIHKCLAEHPDVFVSTPKELHFFDRNYNKGISWYMAHFQSDTQYQAYGEVTPDYISHENAPKLIHDLVPAVRIVAVLREPIERAHSLYQLKRGSSLNYATFEQAIDHHPEILEHGLYARHLQRWQTYFSQDQILVLLYDDLVNSDAATISQIFAHIGVEKSYVPSWIGKADNATILPNLRHRMQRLGLEPLVKMIGRTRLGDAIRRRARKMKTQSSKRDQLSPQTRARLECYYREPNRILSKMLNRTLPDWPT